MWPVTGLPDGTFYFGNNPNQLDQFLVNVNVAGVNSPLRADPDTVEIIRFPGTVAPGVYPKPRPFGGMGNHRPERLLRLHPRLVVARAEPYADTGGAPRRMDG